MFAQLNINYIADDKNTCFNSGSQYKVRTAYGFSSFWK